MAVADWKWGGFAGHLIVARYCRYHLVTDVGDFRVSTVGAYEQPGAEGKWTDIGHMRKFETMVFHIGSEVCGCGCGERSITDWAELESRCANTPAEAHANHMAVCQEIDSGELSFPVAAEAEA